MPLWRSLRASMGRDNRQQGGASKKFYQKLLSEYVFCILFVFFGGNKRTIAHRKAFLAIDCAFADGQIKRKKTKPQKKGGALW